MARSRCYAGDLGHLAIGQIVSRDSGTTSFRLDGSSIRSVQAGRGSLNPEGLRLRLDDKTVPLRYAACEGVVNTWRMSRPAWNLGGGPEQVSYAATSLFGV
jgi:hypothetical protein